MKNKPIREIKQLEEDLIYYEYRIKYAPSIEEANRFYEMGVEKSMIYYNLLGHYPTRFAPQRNKTRGGISDED